MKFFEDISKSKDLNMRDQAVFEQVFRSYHALMCVFAEKIVGSVSEAEDVVEEVFLRLWEKQMVFDNEDHVRFFLYRAIRNESLNHIKIRQRSIDKHISAEVETVYVENYLQNLISSEVLLLIYKEISFLPTQEKKVITLNLLQENSLSEIAEELGLSLQSVKNYKTRALAKLRLRLLKDALLALICLFACIY